MRPYFDTSVYCCLSNDKHKLFHVCPKRNLYWLFATLRIILNFIPQTGYIHPDEFFQSIEVASGDTFDIDVYKPWEFNVTFPVRNALIPQLCVKFPYFILQGLNPFCEYFGYSLKSPYFLVLFPRLAMTALSFISDYCLLKICLILNEPYVNKLTIFASCYVTLVHCTRTLSNSIETILTSVILYRVSRCMELSHKVVTQSDYLAEKYYKAKTGVERTKIYKLRMLLPSHSLNDCLLLATVTAFGIFNRPTFIAFAAPPIFFWLQRGLGSRSIGFLDFHIRICQFIFFTLPTVLGMILYDSLYFGYLTYSDISKFEMSINNFVVTPFNFLKYNSITNNLKNHGLHPRFLHFIVNVPLLFNVLGVIAVLTLIKMINSFLRGKWLELPRVQSVECLMLMSFAIPVALLSIFPHQEPRFIIPVLLPLVFLFAHWIEEPIAGNKKSRQQQQRRRKTSSSDEESRGETSDNSKFALKSIWYLSNVVLAIFYGFMHQGAVLPLTTHLAKELRAKPHLTYVHLVTSHTYPIPTGLLHLRNTQRMYASDKGNEYMLTKDFYLNELGSSDVEFTYNKISRLLEDCESDLRTKGIPYRLYYALPFTFYNEFEHYATQRQQQQLFFNDTAMTFQFHTVKMFYPHLSVEQLPGQNYFSKCFFESTIQDCLVNMAVDSSSIGISDLFKQFNLLLLRIQHVSYAS